jgi:hypothetical protein
MKMLPLLIALVVFSCTTNQDSGKPAIRVADTDAKNYDTILATECEYKDLSDQFDIKLQIKRFRDTSGHHDSCIVKLRLTAKQTQRLLDSLQITSDSYYEMAFTNCDNVLSYATKKNINRKVVDNHFGDIIIADLNFDQKDDIAVMNDSGGNGGPFYNYYLQDRNSSFPLNRFLTDSMIYFPHKINSKAKTLTTYVHAGACGLGEHIYFLQKSTGSWKEKSHRIINICKE